MFDRFTDRARRSMSLAQDEARRLGHPEIDTGHLLAGLAGEGDGVAGKALHALGTDLPRVRNAMETVMAAGSGAPDGHLPFTPALKTVLEYGQREAVQLGCPYIGTEHLLLGLVRDCETTAGSPCTALFTACGTRHAAVRIQVVRMLAGYAERDRPEPRHGPAGATPGPDLARLTGMVEAICHHLGITVPPSRARM